ncbi:MAG: F0F1 ATP synthase subunit gamma [Gammaproteobacteria bacterium]|nr:F0F1 ATP synthase subunit gamma [Gammaproteobacteria bacterium]
MPGAKEIRSKIGSVKNTQKITRAMEMVAASKIRRTQQRMTAARPYADGIRKIASHLYHARPDYTPPYLAEREEKSAGYILISTDRGLCGGLNVNLFRHFLGELRRQADAGVATQVVLIGAKAVQFFRNLDVSVTGVASHLGEKPHIVDLVSAVRVLLEEYREGQIDRMYLARNVFVNTMRQQPVIEQLLPVALTRDDALAAHWDYIYEPSAGELLDGVLERYIETQVFRAAMENVACEMAAKMVAMKSATDNAGKLIDSLQLQYNKARQAAITAEIAEIIGGAEAV